MIALSVNLNKVALLRNSRDTGIPDLAEHARMVLAAGADGITAHPRPDQRHIRAADCIALRALDPAMEFNIEGNPFAGPRPSGRRGVGDYPGFMAIVREVRPRQCTLVPDGENQLTSDHGFDMAAEGERLAPVLAELKALGIRSSLFMDPDLEQIRLAAAAGADRIELYTESYARAFEAGQDVDTVYGRFADAARLAGELGLGVNAGHDLNLRNLPRFRDLPGLLEVSIGHALTVDALRMGFAEAVRAYQRALGKETREIL